MKFADSHGHLTAREFLRDQAGVLRRARKAGVRRMVAVATTARDARKALSLARREAGVCSTAGIHPHEADISRAELTDQLREIRETAAERECVAIGEAGLDYHYPGGTPAARQRRVLEAHLELAHELDLPVVLHSRAAEEDIRAMLRASEGFVTGVVHCFGGPPELLDAALEAGWMVSFTGIVSYPGFDSDIVRATPSDRYMIETDCPHLAPAPKRGRRNEPAFAPYVAEAVATLRGERVEKVAADSWANARKFFRL